MCRMQFLFVFVALYVEMVHSWDFATSAGDDTLRFYTNESLTSTISIPSRKLYALTYDEVHNMMLYVNKQTNNDCVCGYDLTTMENKCFTDGSGRNIHDLAFDPVTERVFFTNTNDKSINWISLKPKTNNKVNRLIKMNDGIPRDIVVDSCEGYIYWLNTRPVRSTIEKARFDGTEREVFETLTSIPVNGTLKFEPSSLAIDQPTRVIYWLEPASTSEYRLFTSALNKKHTNFVIINISPTLIKSTSNSLAVSKNSVIRLNEGNKENYVVSHPKTFAKVEHKYVYADKKMPISIVANYTIKDQIQGCEALSHVTIFTEYDGPYCVHGMKVNNQSACKCTPGYIGERCDVYVCDNYCLQGNCSFSDKGLPMCRCNAGYTGERCDVSVCENYCLRGNCSFIDNGLPKCRCDAGYSGKRCQFSTCENFCMQGNCSLNDEGLPQCRCNSGYTGERCEVNACLGFCLNNGECSLNEEDEPACECVGGHEGTRCESVKSTSDFNHTITIIVNDRGESSTYSCLRSNQPFIKAPHP